MGIRGTTGYALEQVATVNANAGNVTMSFAAVADPGTDRVGEYDLIDQFGNVVAIIGQAGIWTNVPLQSANLPPTSPNTDDRVELRDRATADSGSRSDPQFHRQSDPNSAIGPQQPRQLDAAEPAQPSAATPPAK